MSESPLGRQTLYPDKYDPGLLAPIPRNDNRQTLGIDPQALIVLLAYCGDEAASLAVSGSRRVECL